MSGLAAVIAGGVAARLPPAVYKQLVATCVGPGNPKCQVAHSDDRYAIVTLVGDASMATLDVTALPPDR